MNALTRGFSLQPLEVRSEGDGRTVYGIVVPYGQVARVSDGGPFYKEAFERGAFRKSLAERGSRPVPLLAQHDRQSFAAGASTEFEDKADGLYGAFKMLSHDKAEAALEAARAGVAHFSVGFGPIAHRKSGGVVVRTEARLSEVSLVTFPAYEGARVMGVRALDGEDAALAQQLLTALAVADAQLDPIVEALCAADGALDAAQAVIAKILSVPEPEPDEDDADEADPADAPDMEMASSLTSLARRLDEAIARRGSTTPIIGAGTDEPDNVHSGRFVVVRNNLRVALIERGLL
jgi:HK97 family phage prohead protease